MIIPEVTCILLQMHTIIKLKTMQVTKKEEAVERAQLNALKPQFPPNFPFDTGITHTAPHSHEFSFLADMYSDLNCATETR